MKDEKMLEMLAALIDGAFANHYSTKENKVDTKLELAPQEEQPETPLYESIEDYTAQTGKRFRMTKRQKELGYTREEAFKLTYGGSN